jgi:pyruvate decarboxylase
MEASKLPTAQSIGDMLQNKLDVTIFLINRWVHDMDAPYNDVPMWKYVDVPKTFGATA